MIFPSALGPCFDSNCCPVPPWAHAQTCPGPTSWLPRRDAPASLSLLQGSRAQLVHRIGLPILRVAVEGSSEFRPHKRRMGEAIPPPDKGFRRTSLVPAPHLRKKTQSTCRLTSMVWYCRLEMPSDSFAVTSTVTPGRGITSGALESHGRLYSRPTTKLAGGPEDTTGSDWWAKCICRLRYRTRFLDEKDSPCLFKRNLGSIRPHDRSASKARTSPMGDQFQPLTLPVRRTGHPA